MFSLKSRKDGFRLVFPKDFIAEEIEEKYAAVLREKHSFITSPIDFLNETIQGVQVLGFTDATITQQQTNRDVYSYKNRIEQNNFLQTSTEVTYRSEVSPIQLIDKTLNVTFRHTLGYVNYFLLFENFFYQYARDTEYSEMVDALYVDILDEHGCIYSRIELLHPVIASIDMLDLTYTDPVAQSATFQVVFKYSNLDFQFIMSDSTEDVEIEDVYNSEKTSLNNNS